MESSGSHQKPNKKSNKKSKRTRAFKECHAVKVYKIDAADYKKAVSDLTVSSSSSQQPDTVCLSPLAHVSRPKTNSKRIRGNGASPGFQIRTNAVTVSTSTANSTNAIPQSSSSLPSPLSLPSVTRPSQPSVRSLLPPPSPKEQVAMEASLASFMNNFDNDRMAEDDLNPEQFSAWFPLLPNVHVKDVESIPLPTVPATLPPADQDLPNACADLPPENIPLPVPAILPSADQDLPNAPADLPPENIPLPVPAILPSADQDLPSPRADLPPENISSPLPETLSSELLDWFIAQIDLQPENIPPLIPATLPSVSLDCPNSQNDLRWQNIQPPADPPSGILSWRNPTYGLPSENIQQPFSAPSTSMNPPHGPHYPHLLGSENIPPPAAPADPPSGILSWPNRAYGLPSGNIQQPFSAPSTYMNPPHGPNYPHILGLENIPPPPPAPTDPPSRILSWRNPTYGLPSGNVQQPFSAPSTSMNPPHGPNYRHLLGPPPAAPTDPPSGILSWRNRTYGLPSENVQQPFSAPSTSMNLPHGRNYPHRLGSENIPPPSAPTDPSSGILSWRNRTYDLPSENIPPPPAPANPPSRILSWRNVPSKNTPQPFSAPSTSMNPPHGPKYPRRLGLENTPSPPAPATLPSGNLQSSPYSGNNLRSVNMPPPRTIPSASLSSWPNLQNGPPQSENVPPSVPATFPSWPNNANNVRSESSQPVMQATLPSGRLDTPNDPNDAALQSLAQLGFGTVPSWHLDWNEYPSVRRVANLPSNYTPTWPSSRSD